MIVRGVDVSHHQAPGKCDWSTAYLAGTRFAYVKGSEGAGGPDAYVDPAAREHVERIRRTPILIGMFHFARPDNRFRSSDDGYANGVAEAEHAAATAIDLGVAWSDLPVAIDHEKYTPAELGITKAQRDAFLLGMVDTFERELGRTPMVYTGDAFMAYQHSAEMPGILRARGVPLWLVDYTRADDPPGPIPGWPWVIWQHSGGGKYAFADPIPGLPDPVDQNVYRGSLAELTALRW
jgi:GH25 family lysozyme M1 (1,4-beta-N-acetylmuramidase)